MENEVLQVKQALYAGMSIYKELINSVIEINSKKLTLEDKKYMSLYLGLLNTPNIISDELKETGFRVYKRVKYRQLTNEEYLNIYKENFVEIFNQIDYESVMNYFEYLLTFDVVENLNKAFRFDMSNISNKSNKQMAI